MTYGNGTVGLVTVVPVQRTYRRTSEGLGRRIRGTRWHPGRVSRAITTRSFRLTGVPRSVHTSNSSDTTPFTWGVVIPSVSGVSLRSNQKSRTETARSMYRDLFVELSHVGHLQTVGDIWFRRSLCEVECVKSWIINDFCICIFNGTSYFFTFLTPSLLPTCIIDKMD